MAEKCPARNLVVTEEDLPLVFAHLDKLLDDARTRGLAITEVGKRSDPAGEKVVTRDEYPHASEWFRLEREKSVGKFTEWVDLAFGLTEMLSFRLKLVMKRMGVYPILAPPAIRRRLGFAEATMPEINEDLIRESWDDMARVLASVQEGILKVSRVFAHVRDLSPKAFEGFREVGRSARSRFLTSLLGDAKERARFDLSFTPPAETVASPSSHEERVRDRDGLMAAWREKWGEISNEFNAACREAENGNRGPLNDLLHRVGTDRLDQMRKESESMLGSLSSVLAGDFADGNLDLDNLGFAPEDLLKGRDVTPGVGMPPGDVYAPCPCGSGKKYKFCCRTATKSASLPAFRQGGQEIRNKAAGPTPSRAGSGRWKPPEGDPQFQPLEMLDPVASNLKRLASDSREFFSIILEGSRKPGSLDDALVSRMENVLEERFYYLGLYREQLRRWGAVPLTEEQADKIGTAAKDLAVSQELTDRARAKVETEIRPHTIDRILSKSDLEVGVDAVRRLLSRAGL
ncbi:MAG: Tn3 family transposase [Nitrospirae bacterium]|nr:Tn3 family transposase [Nitrospirota bacterium]